MIDKFFATHLRPEEIVYRERIGVIAGIQGVLFVSPKRRQWFVREGAFAVLRVEVHGSLIWMVIGFGHISFTESVAALR